MASGLMLSAECDRPFVPADAPCERLVEWLVALPDGASPPVPRHLALVMDHALYPKAVGAAGAFDVLGHADHLGLYVVDGRGCARVASAPASPAQRAAVIAGMAEGQGRASGSACLQAWFDAGMRLAVAPPPGAVGHVTLLVGCTVLDERLDGDAVELRVRQLRQVGVGTSIIALGAACHLPWLAYLAEQGGGRLYAVEHALDIDRALRAEWTRLARTRVVDTALTITAPAQVTLELLGDLPHQRRGDALSVSLGALGSGERRGVYTRVFVPAGSCGAPLRLAADLRATVVGDGAGMWAEAAQTLCCTTERSERAHRRVREAAARVEMATAFTDALAFERLGRHRQAERLLYERLTRLLPLLKPEVRGAGQALIGAVAAAEDAAGRRLAYAAAYRALQDSG